MSINAKVIGDGVRPPAKPEIGKSRALRGAGIAAASVYGRA